MTLDKENTMRIMKGEMPIQSFKCRIGIHRWTLWTKMPSDGYNRKMFVECQCADCNMQRIEPVYSKQLSSMDGPAPW